MKIGLVLDDSLDRNDGVQQYIKSLGGWLTRQGHIVHYLVGQTESTDEKTFSLSKNLSVKFNGNRLSIPYFASTKAIKKLLNQQKYDVLHVQMPFSPVLAGKIVRNAPNGTSIVGTFHVVPLGWLQKIGSRTLSAVQRRILKRFEAICSVSGPAQDFALSKFGIDSVVIPNMIDTNSLESSNKIIPGRIVFFGRLVPRKGCMEFLIALELLKNRKDLPPIEVLIAGTGPQAEKLKSYCKKAELDMVTFTGYVEESQKSKLLSSAEIAVFPSLGGESFGIVLIEAMSAGSGIVIGGDNLGYKSVLSDWPQSIFNPRDSSAFAKTIELFLTNQQLRNTIHKQQQIAVKQYDTSVVGAKILQLYKRAQLHRRRQS